MPSNKSGELGEQYAVIYLTRKDYKIKERNYRCRFGEIDIIMQDKDTLVFVEVKTRKNSDYGRPAEFVTLKKQEKLRKTAWEYLSCNDIENVPMRFDVIEIWYEIYHGRFLVKDTNHIINAF